MSNDVCFKTFPILVKVWNINDRIVKDVWNEIKFMWKIQMDISKVILLVC